MPKDPKRAAMVKKTKAAKAPARKRVPMKKAGKKAPLRRRLVHPRMLVRQEGLGQVTETKISVPSGRADTRARMIKAIGTASNYNKTDQFFITGSLAGTQTWSSFSFATQSALQNINTFIGSANGVTFNQPARFLLENVHLTYEFQNLSSAPQILKIYVLRPKRDTWVSNTDPMTFVSASGNAYPWTGYPESAIQEGYNAQVSVAAGSNNYLNPAVAPTTVNLFNKYYQIDREVEIEMAQGGVHRFELNRHYDKVCDGSIYGSTALTSIMGLTGLLLFRVQGTPVHDTTSNTMTLSPANLGVVAQTNYRFTQVFSPVIASKDANSILGAPGDVLQTVNPGSGAVATVTSA